MIRVLIYPIGYPQRAAVGYVCDTVLAQDGFLILAGAREINEEPNDPPVTLYLPASSMSYATRIEIPE